ncbi:DNA-processing protein DprA [Desulfosporosinus sp.]|uniref:DNA-processing protein DprA n=1 Tax=Desulfosporosinus sp. TaxID=157907 RepID=UPI0025C22345|nr:DNA-processing protein DprA [Desulfosporosinus sp.]MBC2723397.1 DNA-processing protein DprA [Desulfosporosinus sp.]MBC2725129.1 DNA-processing protein DprA [Desulfosporosinus sp.]
MVLFIKSNMEGLLRIYFPLRNRLLSAWIDQLHVEAAERSGALITASYASKQKRRIYAFLCSMELEGKVMISGQTVREIRHNFKIPL